MAKSTEDKFKRKVLSAGARIALNADDVAAQTRAFGRLCKLTDFIVAWPILTEYIKDKSLIPKIQRALLLNEIRQHSPLFSADTKPSGVNWNWSSTVKWRDKPDG